MREFLGIRFNGCPNFAAIVNFRKKKPIVSTCLAAASLFLMASTALAMPKTSNMSLLSSLFIKPNNSDSKNLAAPSPSCFSRSACIADANFQQEFMGFVNFIHSRYPSAQVPSAERLQRHACNMLSPGGSHSAGDLEPKHLQAVKMEQWLATYLSYSFWITQSGMNPYQTSPVWWCFLDNSSRYVVTDTIEVDGASNIIANFDGLGKPAANGGAGFYVSQALLTDAYPGTSLEPGFYVAQTYTNKELVAIDLAAPGTTKPLAQYQSLMKIQVHETYPRRTISLIQETVNRLATVEWLGLCSFACTNCAPGTICPQS
ncbi:hypothetical protein OQJ02_14500 [Legionella sp. PATHC032]|uniref:hypothetical protein n=1 Tax=Legionella sp. PATHC032 TaxID=2992039 RepID=UPI001AFFEFB5|nr:hypothetical protein [Legionella sp. PATHC032]MCW8422836.1 hypothetical protein [Legionella sp. PATHC032]HAZ7572855.1 hypothetical protein [Legionella pneumophila]HBA1636119.1 hypothetical protein [Legionella pneumophila]